MAVETGDSRSQVDAETRTSNAIESNQDDPLTIASKNDQMDIGTEFSSVNLTIESDDEKVGMAMKEMKIQEPKEYLLKEMTEVTGDYGPWQKSMTLLCLLTCFPYVWQELSYGFHVYPLDHWCSPPENLLLALNTSDLLKKWKSSALPKEREGGDPSKCQILENSYDNDKEWRKYLSGENIEAKFLADSRVASCKSWQFDHSNYGETIIERFNLVCRKSDQIYLGRLIYTVGFVISSVVFGNLGDKVGRRPVMLICTCLLLVSAFFVAFSISYVFYVVLRFAVAAGTAGLFITSIVMLMEISGPNKRALLGTMMALVTSVAFLLLPGIAWLAKDWVVLQLSVTIPCVVIVVFWWRMPESPRWLLATGRLEKARNAVEKAADINHKSVAQIYITANALFKHLEKKFKMQIITSDYATIDELSILDVLKSSTLRSKILFLYLCWFVSSLTYNGLSVEDDGITDDIFVNLAIVGAVQIPSILITYAAITKLGRRLPLSITLMATTIVCLALIPINDNLRGLFIVAGNAFLTSSTTILYILTSEIFPTPVRNFGVGVCFAIAGLGAIMAPFINEIAMVAGQGIPLGIFAVLSAITAYLVLQLPETQGRQISDDIEEAEELVKYPVSAEMGIVENTAL